MPVPVCSVWIPHLIELSFFHLCQKAILKPMTGDAPTYNLGPEFRSRLREYVEQIKDLGYRKFATELGGIDQYVQKNRQQGTDESLRFTPKDEYLLELISFLMLDDLNREAFNKTEHTLIVMPDCLSLHNPDCLRSDEKSGDICNQCQPDCQASQIVDLAGEYGAHALFSKRKLVQQLEQYKEKLGSVGVIGVACINMLAMGMRSAGEASVPSRGVLLNFSGCEHWKDKPCASEFTLPELEKILREKHERQNQNPDY